MTERSKAQKEAQKRYMEKFIIARVRMTPERLEAVKAHAEGRGESISGFINRAIDEAIERETPGD